MLNNSKRISVAGYDITPSDDDLYYNEKKEKIKNYRSKTGMRKATINW